jgi:CheY-like chemotaxis protein
MTNRTVKLLIVDDEPTTRTLMTQIFHQKGHTVQAAEDGFAALTQIRKEIPDVILSDLNMPGMSGFELLSVVRRRFPAIRAIAMSGAFSGDSVQPGVAADAFYEKASGVEPLLEIMEAITDPQEDLPEGRRAPAPFWIQADEDLRSGKRYVTISCPECLRTFPQNPDEAASTINIHATPCVYCSTTIHFAIVQPTNPASPQTFQRKPPASSPPALKLPRAN